MRHDLVVICDSSTKPRVVSLKSSGRWYILVMIVPNDHNKTMEEEEGRGQ